MLLYLVHNKCSINVRYCDCYCISHMMRQLTKQMLRERVLLHFPSVMRVSLPDLIFFTVAP